MINGVTWPIPKKNKKIIDIIGFLACDTQARRVAKTGVMQGEEASPKVVPMAKGAINVGILSSIISYQVHSGTETLESLVNLNPLLLLSGQLPKCNKMGFAHISYLRIHWLRQAQRVKKRLLLKNL